MEQYSGGARTEVRVASPFLAPDINLDFPAPWFMRSDYTEDERYKVLPLAIKELDDNFMRDRYVVIKGAIDESVRLNVLDELRGFIDRNKDYFSKFRNEFGYLERVINLHLALHCLVDMFSSATRVLEFQDALFASKTSIYTSLYFEKGSSQDIHRDTPILRPVRNIATLGHGLVLRMPT